MVNYQNGKVYKLTSSKTEQIYIGSTTQTLKQRICQHHSCYKRHKNDFYHYMSSYEIIKYDDVVIALVENYPCNTKEELFAREQHWKEQFENTVNSQNIYSKIKSKYIDYKNAKIYKIVCSQTNDVYIGSTCRSLRIRLSQHILKPETTAKKLHNIMIVESN